MSSQAFGPALIVGGSPQPSEPALVSALARRSEFVVAVDRGLDVLLAAGCPCDLFCGDVDSVSETGAELVARSEAAPVGSFEVERYRPAKDYTDLALALEALRSRRGVVPLVATCLYGGAPDQFLAVLGRLSSWEGPVELVEDGFSGRILKAGQAWELGPEHRGHRFSFVPLAAGCTVSERGMRWELDHARAEALSDLGISNMLDAPHCSITCHEGALVCWVFTGDDCHIQA